MEISTAARRLLDVCVIRESRVRRRRATGGRLSGVGEYSILILPHCDRFRHFLGHVLLMRKPVLMNMRSSLYRPKRGTQSRRRSL